MPNGGDDRGCELFVVSGSHFDLGWCGDPAECLAYSDFIIRTAIDAIVGEYPGYRFTVEYAFFMEHFLRRFPEYEPIARGLVRDGRLEVCATAVGSMEQILDGELLIRAVLEGRRYVKETFGVEPLTAQHTDLPGHAAQMPQILAKAGIRYMTGSRFHPHAVLFRRVAPDGSSVVFAHHGHHYKWGYELRRGLEHCLQHLPGQIDEIARYSPVPRFLMAEEHDLDMPDLSIMRVIDELNSRDLPYKLRPSTVTGFFESIDPDVELQSFVGEAPYGFYTAPAFEPDIYAKSREAQNYLATAEKLSSMRHLHGLGLYPRDELRSGWRALFYPQDHNFAGRHGAGNEEQRLNKAIYAFDTGKSIAREAGLALAVNIAHRREGFPITIYNPCNWARTDAVEARAEFRTLTDTGVVIHDGDGNEIPCQLLGVDHARDGRYDFTKSERAQFTFVFVAQDVPPLGYRTYYVTSCPEPRPYTNSLTITSTRLCDDSLALTFDDAGLRSIVRLSDGRELVDASDCLFAEPVVLEDLRADLEDAIEEQREKELWADVSRYWPLEKETLTGRRWRASEHPIRFDVVESGPVRCSLRMTGKLMDSSFEQTFSLYEGLDRIDVNTKIDWQGTQNTLVTLPMRFAIDEPEITYESPFAAIRLETDEFDNSYRGIGGREIQKWADISGDGVGVTAAVSSGSHFLRGNEITPIVLKSACSTGDAFHLMENRGTWEFAHRIVAHAGDWRSAKSYRAGWDLAAPLLDFHFHPPLATVPGSKELADIGSLLEVEADHVVVTTVKQSDYSDGFIVRLFDAEGYADPKVIVRFASPPKSVKKVNLLEEPIEDLKQMMDRVCLSLGKWEIATLLVEY